MSIRLILNDHINDYATVGATNTDAESFTVSFVVPVFNSEASIIQCVRSIAEQQNSELIKEVVLVDDGSTDKSGKIIEELKREYEGTLKVITIHNQKRQYAAYARNRGIEQCSGDLVCFIDSDIILQPSYMTMHIRQHHRGSGITFSLRRDIVAGQVPSNASDQPNEAKQDYRLQILEDHDYLQGKRFQLNENVTLADLCLTCAITYKRNDLLSVRGCPENFIGWGFNDKAMAAKVIALKRTVTPVMSMTSHLSHPPRSGTSNTKWKEYKLNRQRYEKMLNISLGDASKYHVPELDLDDLIGAQNER